MIGMNTEINMADYSIKWWKKYIEADILDRSEMIKKLPIANSTYKMLLDKAYPKNFKKIVYNQMLQSLFDDCIEEVELKNG